MRLKGISEALRDALRQRAEGPFFKASSALAEAKDQVREGMQAATASEIRKIISKLGGAAGEEVTAADLDLVRAWLVGDAESYVRAEQSLDGWLAELERLRGVIASYEKRECSAKELMELPGVLEDAMRLSYDLANYYEAKARVHEFEEATKDRSSLNRGVLARVLARKLESPNE